MVLHLQDCLSPQAQTKLYPNLGPSLQTFYILTIITLKILISLSPIQRCKLLHSFILLWSNIITCIETMVYEVYESILTSQINHLFQCNKNQWVWHPSGIITYSVMSSPYICKIIPYNVKCICIFYYFQALRRHRELEHSLWNPQSCLFCWRTSENKLAFCFSLIRTNCANKKQNSQCLQCLHSRMSIVN